MSFPLRYCRHTTVALPAESTRTNGDSSPMLITPETFIGRDQPGAALAGDATKPAAKQPAMATRRNHERGECVLKRLVAPPNIIRSPPHPASSSRYLARLLRRRERGDLSKPGAPCCPRRAAAIPRPL